MLLALSDESELSVGGGGGGGGGADAELDVDDASLEVVLEVVDWARSSCMISHAEPLPEDTAEVDIVVPFGCLRSRRTKYIVISS